MDGAQVVAHVAELSRLCIALVVCVVDGLGRPDADVAVYAVSVSLIPSQATHNHGCRDAPPPAEANLFPSGETWQL